MKKILTILMLFIGVVCCNAQIYNTKKIVDKFDDTISQVTVKTLITVIDSTIVFETKGEKPEVYRVYLGPFQHGNKDRNRCVNLVGNYWGVETFWGVTNENGEVRVIEHREICNFHFEHYSPFQYEDDMWFIWDENDSRIIYNK